MNNNLMKYENKLIKLLELEVVSNENNYELFKKGVKVGVIEKQEELGEFYYITKIDIDNLHFYKKRNIDKDGDYIFFVDLDNGKAFISINLDINPCIIVYDNDRTLKFRLSFNELYIENTDKTKKGDSKEILKVKANNRSSLERYLGTYYSYQLETTSKTTKKYKLSALKTNKDITLIQNTNKEDSISSINTTIREIISKDSHGKDLFKRFREYIDYLLKTDNFLKVVLEDRGVIDDAFACFYEDLLDKNRFRMAREINDEAMLGVKFADTENLQIYGAIIYDLSEIHEFGKISGYGEYSGSYEWDDKYIYRISEYNKIESVFDIKDRVEIRDKNICQELYNNYKKKKILRK